MAVIERKQQQPWIPNIYPSSHRQRIVMYRRIITQKAAIIVKIQKKKKIITALCCTRLCFYFEGWLFSIFWTVMAEKAKALQRCCKRKMALHWQYMPFNIPSKGQSVSVCHVKDTITSTVQLRKKEEEEEKAFLYVCLWRNVFVGGLCSVLKKMETLILEVQISF